MPKVYITYCRSDRSLAQSISSALKSLGHKVVIDDDVFVPGQAWRSIIAHELEHSDVVVALLTENSLNSAWVYNNVGAARALKKILIPVAVGNIEFPSVIEDLIAVTLHGNDFEEAAKKIDRAINHLENKNIFIVHGQNEAKKWELKSFLADIGLRPVILHEQDDLGKTIMEKYEYYASQAAFAFVLMTPDDKTVVADSTEGKWRARQNVIMELGWFMAKLGRERVMILYKGELEIPSDILGVVYLKFNDSVTEVSEKIRQRLKGVGLLL